jgi:hypothetical protein
MQNLPASWVERIFDRMQGLYGTLWLDRWRTGETVEMAGRSMDRGLLNAKATWAAELAGFADKAECIGKALEACRSQQFPPTLPEFLKLCRDAALRSGNSAPQIAYTPTAEDLQRQREAAQKVAETAQKKTHHFDPMRWCRKPGSQIAMDHIIEEARSRGNQVLAKVLDELIETGICTQAGKLLKRWDRGEWGKA